MTRRSRTTLERQASRTLLALQFRHVVPSVITTAALQGWTQRPKTLIELLEDRVRREATAAAQDIRGTFEAIFGD